MACASSNAPSSGGSEPWPTVSREQPAEEVVLHEPLTLVLRTLSTEGRRRVLVTSAVRCSPKFQATDKGYAS
jgi:hypothetical protein